MNARLHALPFALALACTAAAGDEAGTTNGTESSDTTGDGDGDVDGDVPPLCMGEPFVPFAGSLCGPVDRPCTMGDYQLDPPAYHGAIPVVAVGSNCQPHVLYSVAEGGFFGHYATYDEQGWRFEPTPMPVASGGLVVDPITQIPTVVVYDAAFGVTTWVRDATWQQIASFDGLHYMDNGLARAPDGTLIAGYRTDTGTVMLGSFDGSNWTSDSVLVDGGPVHAAVSLAGVGQVSAWLPAEEGRALHWAHLSGSEIVATYADGSTASLAVQGGDDMNPTGTPHLLFSVPNQLIYATRLGPGDWNTRIVVTDETTEMCTDSADVDGETCNYDYISHQALAVVTSEGGDVRLLWSRIHYLGSLVTICGGEDAGGCQWTSVSDTSTGNLMIGWPSGDVVESTMLGESFAYSGTAAVDSQGRIHMATDDFGSGLGSTTRHIFLGP